MKKLISQIASAFGYTISQKKPIPYITNLRNIDINDPIFYEYIMSHSSANLLLNVPVKNLVILHANAFPLATPEINPWSRACLSYLKDQSFDNAFSILSEFYSNWAPISAREYYGLVADSADSILEVKQPYEVPLPWINAESKSYGKKHKKNLIFELNSHGISTNTYMGWGACGPLHPKKVHLETRRLISTLESIVDRGYLRDDQPEGDIEAFCLIKSINMPPMFLINVGGHRASCLSALRFRQIPIRLRLNTQNIVTRVESSIWPQVVNGTFQNNQAINLFDRIYSCTHPSISQK